MGSSILCIELIIDKKTKKITAKFEKNLFIYEIARFFTSTKLNRFLINFNRQL